MGAASLTLPTSQGWQAERVVWRSLECGTMRVVHIAPGDPAPHWAKAHALCTDIVSTALGLPESWLLPPREPAAGSGANVASNVTATPDGFPIHVLLYISAASVAGVLVGHPLTQAFAVCPDASSDGALCCSPQAQAATVGVRAIWVHAQHRRKGVASTLLDALRAVVLPGAVVLPRNGIAFSPPTPQGRALAEQYTHTREFLVYHI